MAVTGLFLLVFVVGHLAGNLQIFLGSEWLNAYAEHLLELPFILWPARVLLLAALVIHMVISIRLSVENRRARPVAYASKATVQASLASRTMLISGFMIFFFVLFHLFHFTFGKVHPEYFNLYDAKGRHDVYSMVIWGFSSPWIAVSYLLAMFFLMAHLSHGASSFLQTLGLVKEQSLPLVKKIGLIFSILIFVGYTSIPLACCFGWLKPLQGVKAL